MPYPSTGGEVVGPPTTSRRVTEARARAEAQAAQVLAEAKGLAAKAAGRVRSYFPGREVSAEGLTGWPASELIRRADGWSADLVVVGSHGRSAVGRFILGSASRKVVTGSRHSVRAARGAAEKSDGRPPEVMIGVDGSPEAGAAVRSLGLRLARLVHLSGPRACDDSGRVELTPKRAA